GGLLPDLTMLVDVPPEVARARVGPPRDRLEDRPDAFRRLVREGFLRTLEDYSMPIALVDGSADPETVALSLQTEVARVLALSSRS
ncbi:MAG: thymidylate kinase, partial [Isosphaeraceae bacterium]